MERPETKMAIVREEKVGDDGWVLKSLIQRRKCVLDSTGTDSQAAWSYFWSDQTEPLIIILKDTPKKKDVTWYTLTSCGLTCRGDKTAHVLPSSTDNCVKQDSGKSRSTDSLLQ